MSFNILVEVRHPAHVHHFKNFIWEMEKRGHKVLVCAVEKEMTTTLLDIYEIKYELVGKNRAGILNKAIDMFKTDLRVLSIAQKFKPDIFVGRASPSLAHVSWLLKKKYISFSDTEHAKLIWTMTKTFMTYICTPKSFKKNFGKKHVRHNSYHELAYLHPDYFKPNIRTLKDLDISRKDRYFIVRFVSWDASHDIGHSGFDYENKIKLIKLLNKRGKVIITSEDKLIPELEKFRVAVSPDKIHDLLAFSDLYVGEGATMASEAACLGVPAVYVNSLHLGYLEDQEEYGLVYNYHNPVGVLQKIQELLKDKKLRKKSKDKLKILLSERDNMTRWMVEFVEDKINEYQ